MAEQAEIPPCTELQEPARPVPLVVDLDGTLVHTDLLVESLFGLAKRRPLRLFMVPVWLTRGSAFLKHRLAEEGAPDASLLPYDDELVTCLAAERRRGTKLVLATAADGRIANDVGRHLGLFDAVISTDGPVNLSGEHKRDRLLEEFGTSGFDYVGSGRSDRPSWSAARRALIVHPGSGLLKEVARRTSVERVFEGEGPPGPRTYLRAIRLHQWLKNLLVFVPLVATHRMHEPDVLLAASLAFLALSLCASSAYLLNDLLDLPNDRRHPRKKNRPLASGQISMVHAMVLVPALLACGIAVGLLLHWSFLGVLTLYYVLTVGYSLRLKDIVLLDVLALAGLYALRVVAGSAAVGIAPSAWLLAFCIFLFFSLAMVKRYAELMAMRTLQGAHARARAYLLEDRELLAALGGASGYLAVLVLAIYATSDPVHGVYGQYLIWIVAGLLLYWISYMWLMAHRGRMDDDPLTFALKDRASQIVMGLLTAVLLLATIFPSAP